MKRLHGVEMLVVGVLSLIVFFKPEMVRADQLSVQVGLNVIDPKDELSQRYGREYGTGILFSYMYNQYLGVLGGVEYFNLSRPSQNADFSIMSVSVGGQIVYPFWKKWNVSASGGLGLYIWETDKAWWLDGTSTESADLGINYGAGIGYQIFKGIELSTSLHRHRVAFKGNDESYTWNDWRVGARFHLRMIKSKERW